jgi:hypothetical protein
MKIKTRQKTKAIQIQICALVAIGHKNTNAPLILKIRDIIFFNFGQTT